MQNFNSGGSPDSFKGRRGQGNVLAQICDASEDFEDDEEELGENLCSQLSKKFMINN